MTRFATFHYFVPKRGWLETPATSARDAEIKVGQHRVYANIWERDYQQSAPCYVEYHLEGWPDSGKAVTP